MLTLPDRNTPIDIGGRMAHWHSGTTEQPGTLPLTTIMEKND